jgi:hypothetical protein
MGGILQVDTIQNNNTSNLITQTNVTTITIGTSGQNISIPSGATLTGPGAGLIWQSVQTTGFTAVKGNAYPCDTTSAGFTVTLPATPSAGDQVQVVDYAGTFDTNALTLNPNGNKIESGTGNLSLTGEREGVILTYIDSTQGWIATSGINEGTDALVPIFSVDYLIVAGGGGGGGSESQNTGGGGGGAGGAGGLLSGTTTLTAGVTYSITVGGGGAGGANAPLNTAASGTNGSNSVAIGVTAAIGGGFGGGEDNDQSGSGGSGGGSGGDSAPNAGAGTAGQGSNGGTVALSGGRIGGAGGGASASPTNKNGGTGTASSITGPSVTYAGGGGGGYGGNVAGGTGGSGGGGSGANIGTGGNGTDNLGGGAGGGGAGAGGSGGTGGSGVVIIKYPDTLTITNPGGGLTSSTPAAAGGFKRTSFTAGTGNIQFN